MACPYCGATMFGRQLRCCGNPECKRRWNADRVRAFLRRHAATGERYEDRFKVNRICARCGESFLTMPSHGAEQCESCQIAEWRYKGAVASGVAAKARAEQRRLARGQLVPAGPVRWAATFSFRRAQARAELAAAGTGSKRAVWVAGRCIRCHEPFVCMLTNTPPVWCSRACARSDAKMRRRSSERGGHVRYSRRSIFERDRWICQLCGKRVKRTAAVPDPKAPVIDHIVPLAVGSEAGGVDAPWNVQCAHFLCNSIKRDQCLAPALF